MAEDRVEALIQLRRATSRVGPDRIGLLEVVREKGSITAAARALGVSYKGAWDAIRAMNNLFAQPLVVAQPGGRSGARAYLTPHGEALIVGYRKLEAELAGTIAKLESLLAETADPALDLVRSLSMKTSARNTFRGVVEAVSDGVVNAEVVLKIANDVKIVAIVTRESVHNLGLAPGREATALIKSTFVILAKGEADLTLSARNRLAGTVLRHEVGAVNDEVVLDLGEGKTITATITRESGETLTFKPGERAQAIIKASHVILAVD
jgi:molybdate transport system regulatory protein